MGAPHSDGDVANLPVSGTDYITIETRKPTPKAEKGLVFVLVADEQE